MAGWKYLPTSLLSLFHDAVLSKLSPHVRLKYELLLS